MLSLLEFHKASRRFLNLLFINFVADLLYVLLFINGRCKLQFFRVIQQFNKRQKYKFIFIVFFSFYFISFYFILSANYEILIPHKILTRISRHSSFAFGIFTECHNSFTFTNFLILFISTKYIYMICICLYVLLCVCV